LKQAHIYKENTSVSVTYIDVNVSEHQNVVNKDEEKQKIPVEFITDSKGNIVEIISRNAV